jgi:hypothetical protein
VQHGDDFGCVLAGGALHRPLQPPPALTRVAAAVPEPGEGTAEF